MAGVEEHYSIGTIGPAILDALAALGHDLDPLDPDVLGPVEEFHTLGRVATTALADAAGLAGGEAVLDVGCGIGGPARFLARHYGCRVTGIDLTAEFCAVARDLNRRCRLDGRIEVHEADALAMPFGDATFDVVWTQHVAMNIADKAALYRELRRVVRPGGRLAFFDIVGGPNQPIHFPVPWASRPGQSHLIPAGEVREHVEAAGFRVTVWEDASQAALAFFAGLAAPAPGSSPLGLHLVVDDMPTKARNVRRNIEEGRVQLTRCVATPV